MKQFLAFLVLTVSAGAFAQERVVLNAKSVSVPTDSAILVRTSNTPYVVEVTFQVPMANSYCAETRTRIVPQTCFRTETEYVRKEICHDVVTSTPGPSVPRGPNYHNPGTTQNVCEIQNVPVRTRQLPYDCSYVESYCYRSAESTRNEPDSVRIKFKNLPNLGGSEEEEFLVSADQRSTDDTNVHYTIKTLKTVQGGEYEVKKKGIFGYDSYVIEPK